MKIQNYITQCECNNSVFDKNRSECFQNYFRVQKYAQAIVRKRKNIKLYMSNFTKKQNIYKKNLKTCVLYMEYCTSLSARL